MASDSVPTVDRFALTRITTDDTLVPGRQRYVLWEGPDLADVGTLYHTVAPDEVGRLDLVAHKYYGDVRLWWLIAWATNIKNQLDDMEAGMTVVVPDLTGVVESIEKHTTPAEE